MVQRGRDQLVDILLIGWWGGKWELASSTFWFQPVWGLRACGQHRVNLFHLVEVSVSAKQLKDVLMCILEGESGPCPKAALLFLDCSSLVSSSPPFPN